MFALDPDIARQTPEPSRAEPAPKRESEEQNQAAKDLPAISRILACRLLTSCPKKSAATEPCRQRQSRPFSCDEARSTQRGCASTPAISTAAKRFYHDVLGLEIISRMENRGIAFRCGETVLLVFDPERTRLPDAGVPTHGASGEGHIAFVVEESELRSVAGDG